MNKIGYASLVYDLPDANFKTVRLKNLNDEKLRELIKYNLESLSEIIDYNIEHDIKMFRISSSLIPFGSLPINVIDWQEEFKELIQTIKEKLKDNEIRFSVHPGQYTVLNSLDSIVVDNAILELEYHVKVLESFGGTRENKMILHIGGVYGDKESAMERFINVANNRLSPSIRNHLVLENDERSYTAEEVFWIAKQTGLPMVFDNLHHAINPSFDLLNDQAIIKKVNKTWSIEDGKQKIHYSQQDPGKRPGGHSQTINLELFKEFNKSLEVDIMLEVKDKNRSVLKVQLLEKSDMRVLEKEWARYKYLVMSKSYKLYSEIRKLFSNNQEVDAIEFYRIVDEALALPTSKAQELVAIEHIWGYFKKTTSDKTKEKFLSLLDKYKEDKVSLKKIKSFLYVLTKTQEQEYLLKSYYFTN